MSQGVPSVGDRVNGADLLLQAAGSQSGRQRLAIQTRQRSVCYGDLETKTCQYGRALRTLGVGRQDRILLLLDDRPEMFYCYLAAMKIGAVPVALNLRLSDRELAFIVTDSDCRLIVTEADYAALCHSACTDLPGAPVIVESGDVHEQAINLDGLAAEQSGELESVLLEPDEMALWMYTSGTTGTAKGAVHRLASIADIGRYFEAVFGVGPGDRIFCSSKLFFAFALGHSFLATLRLGATAVLHTGWPSAAAIAGVVDDLRPDIVLSVPTLYRRVLADGLAGSAGFKSVRHYISAGEHLPVRMFDEWQAVTGHAILDGIGATETLIMFVANGPEYNCRGATGKLLPATQVRLKSHVGLEITEAGLPGVAWVRSATLAVGYWHQEDKTAAVFQDGWYCTGDVFVRDSDGYFFYQGRDDDMLKISGQWVSPTEIEAEVLQNPNVREAAIVGISDEQGLIRLALCLVSENPEIDRGVLQAELTRQLTANLSVYKCPRRFVYLDHMPKTATGKVQRFKLRQFAADQLGPSL